MTSLDIRNNSAVMKRAEQLKRWEESDTNQQPPVPRPEPGNRIKFSSGCIFLAACLASDKEEVLRMLEQGADINTANVDGLTALHQACIDDNLEMVEFLVEQGADINRQDNEGWTPLHATASCGFVSIARYLVEHGADVAAVNSDGDLAVDLAVDIQHLPMIDFMQKMVAEQQIDCAKARQAEEQQMLSDAKKWLRSDASEVDRPHPKTGATALHVAAAKGYTKVLSLLLAGRANVDAQDNDGWTPLHAAAHWGQKESAEMLLDAMADMDLRNYAAQTCIDVADRKMVKFLEEYRASNKRMKRRPSSQISRISDTIENHIDKTPTKIIRVEVRPENNKDHVNDDKSSMQKTTNETPATEDEAPWRRNNVTRVRSTNESPIKNQVPDNEVSKTNNATTETDVILRRTQSFENDEKFYQKYNELRARIKANSCPIIPATLQQHQQQQQQQHHQQQQQNNNVNNNNNNNNTTIINNSTIMSGGGSGGSCLKSSISATAGSAIKTITTTTSTATPTISSTITPTSTTSSTTNNSLLTPLLSQSPLLATPTSPATTNTLDTTTTNSPNSIATTTNTTTTNSSSINITNIINPNYTVQRSASLKDHKQIFIRKSPPISPSVTSSPATAVATTTSTSSPAAVTTPIRSTPSTSTTTTTSSTQSKSNTQVAKSTTQIKDNNATPNNKQNQNLNKNNNQSTTTSTSTTTTTNNKNGSAPVEPVKQKQSTGNIFKNFFKSFVPPVRDEESETQRKAHAKRVRETRRSTQGVTLDEIKSAEELVKKKNSTMNNNNNNNSSSNEMQVNVTSETTTTATTTTTTPIITTTIEQDLSKEQEQTQPQLQTAETSEIETEKEQEQEQENDKETNASQTNEVSERTEDADEDITASFTIIAPSSATKARPSSLIVTATTSTSQEFGHNEEEVSATFVMPPRKESRTPTPTTENVETTLVVRPVLKDNSPTRDELDKKPNRFPEEDGNEKYSKSSTHNKENENHENKKTEPPPLADVELSAETTTTTTQQPTMKMTQSQRAQSNERIRTAFFNPLPLVTQITTTTTPSNVSSNSAANSTTTTPTLDSPVRLRDKRSLFDIDNASSQTLADKLRSEANKYWNDERRFAGDHSALHDSSLERDTSASPLLGGVAGASAGGSNASYNYNSRRSLDSSSLPNSPLHTRDREAGGCSDSSSTTSTVTSVGGGGGSSCGGVGGSFNNILAADRRPSWRLKFDSGSKFKLEDATSGNTYPPNNSTIIPSAPAVIAAANSMSQRRVNSSNNTISSSNQSLNSIGRPVSAPPTSNLSNNSTTASSNTSTTSSSSHSNNDDKLNDNSSSSSGFGSYSSRRSNTATSTTSLTPDSQSTGTSTSNTVNTSTTNLHSNNDDKDNDKENDNRSALATQAVIQRRRKPKRRSTGVVHIDMDELDPEKQDSANDNEEKEKESGSETRPSRSRVGSTASTVSVSTSTSATDDKKTRDKTENSGDNIDYKALWEAAKLENDKLKQQLKKKDEDVVQTRATLERFANALLQKLKNENERLRAENRALTRVVSKLTSSAQSQLSKSKQ
ncbi:protein phosphatase 1 regulatory subunit 12B isoform X5 [Calliphora vicina]|uniref:protein phosphatase 1 regulatory subunit 12B isoform X5 n=1 Tax=Calliphora vicina TaxID=7373 RepID=UPI00325B2C23